MNCEQAKESLQGLIDNALGKSQRLALKRHLDACAFCRTEYRLQRKISTDLEKLPVFEPSPDFNRAVFQRLGLEYRPFHRPAWQSLAMAAGISLSVFWLAVLAAALPTLLWVAKAYKLAQWLHRPESIPPALKDAALKAVLDAFQFLDFASKVAGWLLKNSVLPAQMAAAGLMAFGLIFLTMRSLRPQSSF